MAEQIIVKAELIDNISNEMARIRRSMQQGLDSIQKQGKKTQESMGGIGKSLISLKTVAIGLGAVLGTKLAKGITSASAEMETLETQFTTLLGSAGAARQRMAELADFARTTPFQLPGIANASRTLQVFGGDVLASQDNLRMIGDAAAATNQDFESTSFWVGRMYSALEAGKPFGEAAMRLQEMAILTPKVRDRMERLQASGASSKEVFGLFSQSMGGFEGAMERQSKTFSGLMSTIRDNIDDILRKVGAGGFFDVMKQGLASVVNFFNDNAQAIERWANLVGAFLGATMKAIGTVVLDGVKIFGNFSGSLSETQGKSEMLSKVLRFLIKGISGVFFVVRSLWEIFSTFANFLKTTLVSYISLVVMEFQVLLTSAKTLGAVIKAVFTGNFSAIPGIVKEGLSGAKNSFSEFLEVNKQNWSDFGSSTKQNFSDMGAAWAAHMEAMKGVDESFNGAMEESANKKKGIQDSITKNLKENTDQQDALTAKQISKMKQRAQTMANFASAIGESLAVGIGKGTEGLKESLKAVLVTTLDFLQKQWLAAQVSAGFQSILGNPLALAKIVAVSAIFSAAKAGIQSFQEGGFPQGRNALVRVNEQGQEAVLNARAVRNIGRENIEAMNRGQTVTNITENRPSIVVVQATSQDEVLSIIEGSVRDKSLDMERLLESAGLSLS